jgi:hypothetical protein
MDRGRANAWRFAIRDPRVGCLLHAIVERHPDWSKEQVAAEASRHVQMASSRGDEWESFEHECATHRRKTFALADMISTQSYGMDDGCGWREAIAHNQRVHRLRVPSVTELLEVFGAG